MGRRTPGEATVLVVDPDGRLQAVTDALRAGGFGTVSVATDVGEAVATVEERDVDGIVVLDATATGEYDHVDGPTQIRELRALVGAVPIVAYLQRGGSEALIGAFEAGADDVCRVPPERTDLLVRKLSYTFGVGGAFDDERTRLRSLFEAYPEDVFLKDDHNRIANHTGEADHLEHFDREWLTNLTDYELFPQGFAEFLYEEEREIVETGDGVVDKIEHYQRPSGEKRWVSTTKTPRYDADGNVVGIVGASLDVTDVKRQERLMAALHEASRQLTRAETRGEIARTTVDIAGGLDPLPRVQVALTDRGGSLHPVVVEGRTGAETAPFRSHERYYRAASRGEGVYAIPAGAETPDLDADVSVERIDAGTDPGLFVPLGEHGAIGFVTEGKPIDGYTVELAHVLAANVEAALDRAERERRLAATNERLREFALLGSHELRNRVQSAFGQLDRLQMDVDSEHADTLETTVEGIDRLVSQLVTLAQSGSLVGGRQPIDVGALARDIWATLDAADATLEVVDPVTVEADPDALAELLGHLLRNAVQHAGPSVTVTLGRLPDADGFFVADDGPGIPEDVAESVFELTYDDAASRSGYGLYIVATIADAHGWTVRLAEGVAGTRVEVVEG